MDDKIKIPIDGEVKVFISGNSMEGYLTVYGPRDGGNPVQLEKAVQALKDAGVVEGINLQGVKDAVTEFNWGRATVVANGTPAVDGDDGRIEYKFALPQDKIKPAELEDGRVDYKNLNLIHNVQRGELLAVRVPPKLGTPGVTVTGKPVLPKAGKNVLLPRGKNTVNDETGNYLYAATDGHVSIVDGKITVFPVFEVPGDVDLSSGNIDFVGNVSIRGNITSGFIVKAGGDIEVSGIIEGATVEAGGNILVKNGIAGGHKAIIKAGGSIFTKFIENASIDSGQEVVITDGIVQSMVKANGSIKVEGKKGTIVGGVLQAGEEISARFIGSPLSPQTVLEVGANPHLREEYKGLFQVFQEKKKNFENISQNISMFQRSSVSMDSLPDKKKLQIVKLLEEFKTIKEELKVLEERKQAIEEEFGRLQRGRVKVTDVIYPGVQIIIGQAVYTVNDPIKFAMFVLEDGDVRVGVLR
ncbi:MAG: DUF342 domain-containing protein [Acidobacteriota bacterium]